jgi:hypothetical protein
MLMDDATSMKKHHTPMLTQVAWVPASPPKLKDQTLLLL